MLPLAVERYRKLCLVILAVILRSVDRVASGDLRGPKDLDALCYPLKVTIEHPALAARQGDKNPGVRMRLWQALVFDGGEQCSGNCLLAELDILGVIQ